MTLATSLARLFWITQHLPSSFHCRPALPNKAVSRMACLPYISPLQLSSGFVVKLLKVVFVMSRVLRGSLARTSLTSKTPCRRGALAIVWSTATEKGKGLRSGLSSRAARCGFPLEPQSKASGDILTPHAFSNLIILVNFSCLSINICNMVAAWSNV